MVARTVTLISGSVWPVGLQGFSLTRQGHLEIVPTVRNLPLRRAFLSADRTPQATSHDTDLKAEGGKSVPMSTRVVPARTRSDAILDL